MKRRKGFTLVELLAVIAILAILVIIVLSNVIKYFKESNKQIFVTESKEIAVLSETKYINDLFNGDRPEIISSIGDTKLDLSGKKLDYYVELNPKGKVIFLEVSNENYCIQTTKDYNDITIDDVIEGKCEERQIEEKKISNTQIQQGLTT